MFQILLDIIFPRRCLACGERGAYFCAHCRQHFSPAENLETPSCLAVFNYDEPAVKKAIWRLKYSGITSLAAEMAVLMKERLAEDLAELAAFAGGERILVVPVPISPGRRWQRGYNQAARLARELAKLAPEILEYENEALIKTKETPAQVTLKNRAARLLNLRNAFSAVNPKKLARRTVLVIDDVHTTGATLGEAIKTLKQSGAETVLGAAFAHRE